MSPDLFRMFAQHNPHSWLRNAGGWDISEDLFRNYAAIHAGSLRLRLFRFGNI
jgi:hypothetical protein